MRIDVQDLSQICEKILDHLASLDAAVEVEEDFYWTVLTDDRYDMTKEPDALGVGQLSDDWSELQRVLNGESDPISYHLVWLGAIFRVIGEKIVR